MSYHLTATVVSRGKGQSMVAKAAYNSRDAITEERTGELKDFSRMKDKPIASFVFAPDELRDPDKLWNFYDAHETRSNAQTGISFIASLPCQLTDEQREFIVKDFMREQFQRKGVAAQADIHSPDRNGDDRNYHVHILASMREVSKDGLGAKVFTWEDKEKNLSLWRQKWAERGARELEKRGLKTEADRWRYGHLTNAQQRKKALERGDKEWAEIKAREADKHLGPAASARERKGDKTERGGLNRSAKNLQRLSASKDTLEKQIAKEREKLSQPPKTLEDAQERAAAVVAGIHRAIHAKSAAFDPMKRDGYTWWQRTAPARSRQSRNVGKAFEKYWRERVWGSRASDHENREFER